MSADTIQHLTGDYWGVEVPESADMSYGFAFDSSVPFWVRYYPKNKRDIHDSRIIELSPGQWEIVVQAKDCTEEQAKEICPGEIIRNVQLRLENTIYPKYDEEFDGEIQCCLTALESYHSLLKSKNLNPETTLIIKKIA